MATVTREQELLSVILHGEALAHCLEEWWEKRGGRGRGSRPLGDAARYLRRKK